MLNYSINDWSEFNSATVTDSIDPGLVSAFDEWDSFNRNGIEWRSSDRNRILLQVVYYRTYETKDVLFLDSGRVIEYDKFNLAACHGYPRRQGPALSAVRAPSSAKPGLLARIQLSIAHVLRLYGMFPVVPFGVIARTVPANPMV